MKPEAINICGLPEPATKLLQQNLEQSPDRQQKILMDCERILQRPLTYAEKSFVRGRTGFIALELVEGSVSQMNAAELVEYLNSDRDD